MKVFKFGGASVRDAESVRKLAEILDNFQGEELLIIVSAIGKTTNALEKITSSVFHQKPDTWQLFKELEAYHLQIAEELFPDPAHAIFTHLQELFGQIKDLLNPAEKDDFDLYYDKLVPFGELLSTRIIGHFLNEHGINIKWFDARELIITDSTYRAAKVDWEKCTERIRKHVVPELRKGNPVISQGFIGGNGKQSTTLGREGSDFTAAIFANILDAEEVVVWKDVPGYLNADPRYFDETVKLDTLSYTETIELAFYGAKIIHPKTIRPLKNKNIPLIVKSFFHPEDSGSVIHEDGVPANFIPSCIIKGTQVLISISARDFSFIAQDHLHRIFGLFSRHRIGINLMQNSAISFSVCVDASPRLAALITELQEDFKVRYNEGLQLLTIRHYDQETIDRLTVDKKVLLEQRSRVTVQMILL